MGKFLILLPLGMLGACRSPEPRDFSPRWKFLQNPAHPFDYFMEMIRCDLPAKAREILSADAKKRFPEGSFTLAVRNTLAPDATKRLILGFEQHSVTVSPDGETALARWCNREFGVFLDIRLMRERLAGRWYWAIDFTREQLVETLEPALMAWYRRQRDAADGRIYAYPPDWEYAPVAADCPCLRGPGGIGVHREK
ncbi:MAG: hypothetical protein HY716_15625 [Planctomycetes bacterium]|nr:hypothetical protein [Planctomycetota bacterium]